MMVRGALAAVVAVALAAAVGAPGAAVAAPSAKADALFKKGKKLLGEEKFAEACAAFEASNDLDPAIGTLLNLALCFEGWGKLATAHRTYLDAEAMAAMKGDARAAAARQRADALAPRIPRLMFGGVPDPAPAELAVTLDGEPVAPESLRIGVATDPGVHRVGYVVAGEAKTVEVELAEAEVKQVELELPAPPVAEPDPEPIAAPVDEPPPPPPASPGRGRRILGVVVGGVGLATLGVGGVVALLARSDYKDAFAAHCDAATNTCDDEGYDLTHDARSRANVATVVVGAGAALVVTGVVLYLTAPSGGGARKPGREQGQVWIRPVVTEDGGAVVVGGSL
jgi:hypothetical protein